MLGMVFGLQVIIIVGFGYDVFMVEGIYFNMVVGSGVFGGGLGEEGFCVMMEGVVVYIQIEFEGSQFSIMDVIVVVGIEIKKEKEDLCLFKKEEKEELVVLELVMMVFESVEFEVEVDGEELDGSDMLVIIYEIFKEFEKRWWSKWLWVMDVDGLLEMFYCLYEGCS